MCGRYDNLIAREAYRLLFNAERLPQSNFPPRYNIAPTDLTINAATGAVNWVPKASQLGTHTVTLIE